MTDSEKARRKRKYCIDCRDNFYNGNNSLGVNECWSLVTSKVVRRKFVHVDQRPPWTQKPEWTLNCCHRERYVTLNPEVVR